MTWYTRRRWHRAAKIRRVARLIEHAYAEQSRFVREHGFAAFGVVYQISRAIMSLGDQLRGLTRARLEVARDHEGKVRRWRRPVPG